VNTTAAVASVIAAITGLAFKGEFSGQPWPLKLFCMPLAFGGRGGREGRRRVARAVRRPDRELALTGGPGDGAAAGAQPGGLRLFLVLGSVTVLGPASMDIYLPGLPQLARDFGASPSRAQLTVTTFLIGLALGQFLAGPLSDVYGRRRPLIAGMAAFTVASLVCSLAPNLYALAAMRLVQGTMAAAGIAVGRAVVRDLYSGAAAARYLSRLMLIVGLGPILAPLVGGQILRFTSWRGVFVALALLGLALMLTGARLLPETLPHGRRRAAGLGETTRTFALLLVDRSFVGFVLITGLGSGAIFGYVAGSSFVLEDVYGASPQVYSVLFGMNAVFLVMGAQINTHLLGRLSPRRLLGFGLTTMVVAAIALLVVVPFRGAGLAAVMPPLTLLMFSWSFIHANAIALALSDHPHVAGTAAALLGVSQFAFGAVVAPLVGIGGSHTALPMAVAVCACAIAAALALKLVPPAPRPQVAAALSET
jgi:DHA1 family bicyclomycin/chloramphenicol resistance-like MFS transporter